MKNIAVILLFSGVVPVFSQNYVDILKLTGNTTAFNTFDTSSSRTTINEIMADLTVPIKFNDRHSLLSGVIYENTQTKLFTDGNVISFGSMTLKLGVSKQVNERWSGTLVLLPKIASDYKTLENRDFQMGAITFMKYKKNDNLTYKFGLYYNSELFGPFFAPMAGLYYLSQSKKFETNLMLPLQADVNYQVFPFVNLGFNFNGQNRSYHLSNATSGHSDAYVVKSTNEFYAYLKFNVSKSFSIQTKIGQSVARSYRVYDGNDQISFGLPAIFVGHKRQQLNSDFSDGIIFQVVLLYRFNLKT